MEILLKEDPVDEDCFMGVIIIQIVILSLGTSRSINHALRVNPYLYKEQQKRKLQPDVQNVIMKKKLKIIPMNKTVN